MLTREEIRKRRSIAGQKAAEKYWSDYHANIVEPNYHELPNPCITIQVTNHMSGKITTMVFHPSDKRRGRFRVDVDGGFWKECGWSDATVKIRKGCKKTPLHVK